MSEGGSGTKKFCGDFFFFPVRQSVTEEELTQKSDLFMSVRPSHGLQKEEKKPIAKAVAY